MILAIVLLAILSGAALGYVLERGDFCFHSTWRGVFRQPPQLDLMRAYLLTLLVAIPVVQGMIALGWVKPWLPPFPWQANLVGGIIFGVGMAVAASCITGLFYKLGHGMLGTIVGLLFWASGDVLVYRGPLAPLREALAASPLTVNGQSATLLNFLGPVGPLLLLLLGAAAAIYLWQSPRADRHKLWGWLPLGLSTGIVISAAWLLARAGGSDYIYGTSGVPTAMLVALGGEGSGGSLWIPVALLSIVPGAFLAARVSGTLWIRGETALRYAELGAGGFLMGVGAGVAGGCNLGHSLVGVPLLSLGSIMTTVAMGIGVFLVHRIQKEWRSSHPQPTVEAT